MRVRGLKQAVTDHKLIGQLVAPHAGAWIETSTTTYYKLNDVSHPMRVRGLKQHIEASR